MRAVSMLPLVLVAMLAKVTTEQTCNCNCGCEPQVIIQDGCPCPEDVTPGRPPNPVLVRKWGQLFDYMNLVKQADGRPEVLDIADYNEFRTRLSNSPLSSIAAQVSAYYFPLHVASETTSQTKEEYVALVHSSQQLGLVQHRKDAEETYDLFTGLPDPLGGVPLETETLVAFEEVIGSISRAETEAYINKITTGDTITKDQLASAMVTYMTDPSSTLEDLPFFGEPKP